MPNVPNMGKVLKNARKGKNAPCMGCTERKLNCHKACDKYALFKQELADVRAAIAEVYKPQRDAKEREMKEMVYSADRFKEVLHSGEYKGYKFCVMSLGTHPTAYVECKLENCNSYNDERLDDISVHCGFTYLGKAYWDDDGVIYLGWDYAHYCDYAGYEMRLPSHLHTGGKKWTTAEIFEEVKAVIDQLIAVHPTEKGGKQG